MTEQHSEQAESDTAGADLPDFTTTADWFTMPDFRLQVLVASYQWEGLGPSVTLYLPWGTAAGSVITQKEFFVRSGKFIRERMAEQGDSEEAIEFQAGVLAEDVLESIKDDVSPKDLWHGQHFIPRHVHLANAQCLVGGRIIEHPVLRLQLSHVTGWALGDLRLG